MQEPKPKAWFVGYTRRFWFPVSWEGWAWFVSMLGLGVAAGVLSNHGEERFSLSRHWPAVLLVVGYVAAFYWFTRGHVDKRY